MPTYLYECPMHGEFEAQHSVTEELEVCPLCANDHSNNNEPCKVKRLIAGGTNFILTGGGWAKDSYR
jgi:putative FmdB family regulatory protein